MKNTTSVSSNFKTENHLTDRWLNFILMLITGQERIVEFSEETTERKRISKTHRFYRRCILRPVKQVLRFIVFGIEDALEKRRTKKTEPCRLNCDENRFKTDNKRK